MSEEIAPEGRGNPAIAWVIIPLYAIIGLCAVLFALAFLFEYAAILSSESSAESYCGHNHLGEGVFLALYLGVPVFILQFTLSWVIGKRVPWPLKRIAELSLPVVLGIGTLPCIVH